MRSAGPWWHAPQVCWPGRAPCARRLPRRTPGRRSPRPGALLPPRTATPQGSPSSWWARHPPERESPRRELSVTLMVTELGWPCSWDDPVFQNTLAKTQHASAVSSVSVGMGRASSYSIYPRLNASHPRRKRTPGVSCQGRGFRAIAQNPQDFSKSTRKSSCDVS